LVEILDEGGRTAVKLRLPDDGQFAVLVAVNDGVDVGPCGIEVEADEGGGEEEEEFAWRFASEAKGGGEEGDHARTARHKLEGRGSITSGTALSHGASLRVGVGRLRQGVQAFRVVITGENHARLRLNCVLGQDAGQH
jgi:hypothetical protein